MDGAACRRLADFLRRHREEILTTWTAAVSALPSDRTHSGPTIRDYVPHVVDELARSIDLGVPEEKRAATPAAVRHAKDRFASGYDVRDVVAEYGLLRRTILERYRTAEDGARPALRAPLAPIVELDTLLDAAVGDAVDQFVAEHDRENDVLSGILSHDLRAPLQSILIGAELLARGNGADDALLVARSARRIHAAAERMSRMITDLMDYTRAQVGGGLPISPLPMDLRTVVADAVADVAITHPSRMIEDHVQSSADDLHGTWGPVRVAQAVTNLLTNAIHHGQDPIVVDAAADGDAVRIDVTNRGEIAAEVVPILFQPFVGLTDRRAPPRRHEGLGLGLYIVSEIARAHGGRVDAVSGEGVTRFRLWLPRHA